MRVLPLSLSLSPSPLPNMGSDGTCLPLCLSYNFFGCPVSVTMPLGSPAKVHQAHVVPNRDSDSSSDPMDLTNTLSQPSFSSIFTTSLGQTLGGTILSSLEMNRLTRGPEWLTVPACLGPILSTQPAAPFRVTYLKPDGPCNFPHSDISHHFLGPSKWRGLGWPALCHCSHVPPSTLHCINHLLFLLYVFPPPWLHSCCILCLVSCPSFSECQSWINLLRSSSNATTSLGTPSAIPQETFIASFSALAKLLLLAPWSVHFILPRAASGLHKLVSPRVCEQLESQNPNT